MVFVLRKEIPKKIPPVTKLDSCSRQLYSTRKRGKIIFVERSQKKKKKKKTVYEI